MDHIPPDMLHCFLCIMKKFISLLAADCLGNQEAQNAFEQMFTEANIKICAKNRSKGKKSWLDKIKKTSLIRTQYIELMDKIEKIAELIDRTKKVPPEKAKVIKFFFSKYEKQTY